jgi:hypothetical protein
LQGEKARFGSTKEQLLAAHAAEVADDVLSAYQWKEALRRLYVR